MSSNTSAIYMWTNVRHGNDQTLERSIADSALCRCNSLSVQYSQSIYSRFCFTYRVSWLYRFFFKRRRPAHAKLFRSPFHAFLVRYSFHNTSLMTIIARDRAIAVFQQLRAVHVVNNSRVCRNFPVSSTEKYNFIIFRA